MLRALLLANGVSHHEIDDYLRGKLYGPDIIHPSIEAPITGSEAAIRSIVPLASTQEPWIRGPCSPGSNCCSQQSNICPELTKLNAKPVQVLSQVAKNEPPKSTCCNPGIKTGATIDPKLGQMALTQPVQNIGKASEPCAPGGINKPLVTEMPASQHLMDDESTCQAAANIIASMRGHSDTEKVLAELGCTSEKSCAVKNITIFELIDR